MAGNAAETLDNIRVGGGQLLLTAQQRLAETKTLLDEGKFAEAASCATQLQEKTMHLAAAETMLGRLAEGTTIRCGELECGMVLADLGTITAIDPCENCGGDLCESIMVTVDGDKQVVLPRDAEIVVQTA